MNEGYIATSDGESIDVIDYEKEFEESHVEHSTALHSLRTKTGNAYLTGPLARVSLNVNQLSPTARRLVDESSVSWPCFNPFQSIVARGLELVHAFEEGQYKSFVNTNRQNRRESNMRIGLVLDAP